MPDINTREQPIRVGISTCLLGERVRFDSGQREDPRPGRHRPQNPRLALVQSRP